MAGKKNSIREVAAAILRESLPGKSDHELIHLSVGGVRGMLEALVALADEHHQTETQGILNSFLGPLMGCGMALEGIADSADTLLQQDPEQGAFMLAEMVRSVQSRLESVTEEMDIASKGGRQE